MKQEHVVINDEKINNKKKYKYYEIKVSIRDVYKRQLYCK